MTSPVIYRGIAIRTFDIPCAPFVWVHDEGDAHGEAPTLDEAKRQIGRHLGPQGGAEGCPECGGTGYEDWSALAMNPCE